ncbi:putative two-component response regulator ARR20 [Macadamia integrifolia]|uniref:putative two-component response regulator ARR20 n=1 Tax=Macadamia integrifolia TaxID=60698 RepID=UPI001C4EEF51|nr:putative two-component response regulator ARR20 [Macadamia integrifolia]
MDHPPEKDEQDDQSKVMESVESKEKEVFPDGMRVLAVDDNIVCLTMLKAVLQRCHYKVTIASDGATALKLLWEEKDTFDIVITDVHMPDMDGFRLLEIVSLEMDIPVIMMSANDDKNMVMKGIKHGARDYLIKPIRKEEIQNLWQHVIRKKLFKPNESIVKKEIIDENSKSIKREREQSKEKESTLNNDHGEDISNHKKQRVVWTPQLHKKFIDAVHEIGIDKAVPKKILEHINEPEVSRENVASHLQKFRNAMKKNNAATESQQSCKNVDSNGINGQASSTVITYSNDQDTKRIPQPDGFEFKDYYKNLGSVQQSRFVQNNSCFPGISPSNPKPFSVLPALNHQGVLLQHYQQVPEIADQIWQRKHINPGLAYFSSNIPSRMDTLHHHTDFNGLKYQYFPPRTTMFDDYKEISHHIPFYNASSGLSSGNFALNGSASTSYPNICFGGSSASSTFPTAASTELSTIFQHDSNSESVQNFLSGHDIQSFSLEQVMESNDMTSMNHPPGHLESENSIDEEDLHAIIRQFQK